MCMSLDECENYLEQCKNLIDGFRRMKEEETKHFERLYNY